MEADEIQIQCKFPRIGARLSMDDEEDDRGKTRGFGSGSGSSAAAVGQFCGWPSSRIVRVSRASGGKDRHSKVVTSKGLRDRRVRLSVNTAIQFYDLQDRLGYDQPSKAVEWLLKAAASSIAELPPMNSPFPDTPKQLSDEKQSRSSTAGSDQLGFDSIEFGSQRPATAKSSACSSNSETSKGSGISLSRSESRMKARERAKERAAEKKIEFESCHDHMNPNSQTFTDLLSGGGINNVAAAPIPNSNQFLTSSSRPWPSSFSSSPMDYFNPFTISGDHHHHQHLQFSFVPENLENGNESGFNRGTLQSNSSSSMSFPHYQRFPDENFSIGADNHYRFLSGHKGKGKK